jgi:glutamate--cysteine ligase catalytic subunit
LSIIFGLASGTLFIIQLLFQIEYLLVEFDDVNKKVLLSLRGVSVLEQLEELFKNEPALKEYFLIMFSFFSRTLLFSHLIINRQVAWRPEYGAHMVEGTPGRPLNCKEFALIEDNMKLRLQQKK